MSVEAVSSGVALERDDPTIAWLLEGDPVIRWQTMRDLLDEPAEVWEAERRRVSSEGWVAAMLEHRTPHGDWPKGRWTDSPWSLLLLVACGLPGGSRRCGRRRRTAARPLHAGRAEVRRRLPAQARRSVPPRLLARARRVLPRRRPASTAARRRRPQRAVRRRRLELPAAEQAAHAPQLVPHDVQRAREPAARRRARLGRRAGVPRRRGARARVHARSPAVPLPPHGRRRRRSASPT